MWAMLNEGDTHRKRYRSSADQIYQHKMSISPLPHSVRPWSIAVCTAYNKLHQIYYTGSSYLNSGSVEGHRLQQYGLMIINEAFPLVLLLSETATSEGVPLDWIENIATEFTALLGLINETWMSNAEVESVKTSSA